MSKSPKPWWKSRGVIGSIGAMLAAAVTMAGALAGWDAQLETGVLGLVLGGVSLWGRLAANAPIKLTLPAVPSVLGGDGGDE